MRRAWLLLLACACGGSAPPPLSEPPPPSEPLLTEKDLPPRSPPRPARRALTRSALNATLDAGPGAFLGRVSVRAAREGRTFVGWQIESLWPGADVELRPGDVVMAVNGRTLERPESLPALFQELRRASEIVVDYRRGIERREARFPVVEDAGTIRP